MDAGSTSPNFSAIFGSRFSLPHDIKPVIPSIQYEGNSAGSESTAIINVESVPFGIPMSLLEESSFLKHMLEDPVIGDASSDDSDEAAGVCIQLDAASNVTAQEMECFVRLLNIRCLDRQIDNIDALDRIDLAIKCSVEKWLVPAYAALCTQEALLSDSVGRRLGLPRFAALSRIRESLKSKPGQDWHTRPRSPNFSPLPNRFGTPAFGGFGTSARVPDATVAFGAKSAVSVNDLIRAEPALAFPRTIGFTDLMA
ncbi:hypothetical protein FRB99_000235 [Tulasnella sp. 403]|nr:hypothetical protein FRB99_000235 [Tulasnella sp. 403]